MACCVLALLYIQHEFTYDRFHENGDRIYRILQAIRSEDGTVGHETGVAPAVAINLPEVYPEVEKAARMWRRSGIWMRQGPEGFNQTFCVIDPEFLEMFDFPLVAGEDPKSALSQPGSILITEKMAKRHFGDDDPIGKVFTVDRRYFNGDYTVTGVLRDLPRNTDFSFDCLTTTKQGGYEHMWIGWRSGAWRPVEVYLQLRAGSSSTALEPKIYDLIKRNSPTEKITNIHFRLQPLERIHLYSNQDYGIGYYGDIDRIYLFAAIAFLILLIACINFMNLATARSTKRAREVGLRKVVGALRVQLVRQFLAESLVLAVLALAISLGLVALALPEWSAFVDRDLTLSQADTITIVLGLAGVAIFVGALSGSYPAFFLSAFRPVDTLKGPAQGGGAVVRQVLVILQFGVSVVLMVCTVTIYQQLDYLRNKNLGFQTDHIVMTYLFNSDRSLTDRYNEVKHAFLQHPGVLSASAHHTYILGGGARELPGGRAGYFL